MDVHPRCSFAIAGALPRFSVDSACDDTLLCIMGNQRPLASCLRTTDLSASFFTDCSKQIASARLYCCCPRCLSGMRYFD